MRQFHVKYSNNLLFTDQHIELCIDDIIMQLDIDSDLVKDKNKRFLSKIDKATFVNGIDLMLSNFTPDEELSWIGFDQLADEEFLECIVPKFEDMMNYYGYGREGYFKLAKYFNRGLKLIDAQNGNYEEKATRMLEIYSKLEMLSKAPLGDDEQSFASYETLSTYEENQIELAVLLGTDSIKLLFELFINSSKEETFNLIQQIDLEHGNVFPPFTTSINKTSFI